MGPRRSGTGRLGTPGVLKTPEMAPMGGTPPKILSNSNNKQSNKNGNGDE